MTDWIKRTEDVLKEQGLDHWVVSSSGGRRTIGMCDYRNKTIILSKHHLTHDSDEDIIDTIFHEVAHALNPLDGHGSKWRKTAKRLGGTGEQYHRLGKTYPSKWSTMCINGHSPKVYRWNRDTIYTCKCNSLLYIKRSDGTSAELSPSYVTRFNRLAQSRNLPLIGSSGTPRL